MALSAGTAYVDIVPKIARNIGTDLQRQLNTPIQQAARKAERDVEDSGRRLTTSFSGMATRAAGLAAAAFAGFGAVSFFKGAITGASDLNESISKVEVVFGDAAGKVREFAKGAADGLGVSTNEALAAAGTFGNLFRAIDLTQGKSAEMSTRLIKLASDLASFNNSNPQEVLDALRSGLVGETEPLRRFGVNLNEARIQAEALRMGLTKTAVDQRKVAIETTQLAEAQRNYNETVGKHGKASQEAANALAAVTSAEIALENAAEGSKGELDAAAKAQAAYSLILKDTTLAQGDFERTSDGLANRQRKLAARFKDLRDSLGSRLLPIAVRFAEVLERNIGPAMEKLADIGRLIDRNVIPPLRSFFGFAKEMAQTFREGGFGAAFGLMVDEIQERIPAIRAALQAVLRAIGGWITGTAIPYLRQQFPVWARAFWEWIKDVAPPALRALGRWLQDVGAWLGSTGLPALRKEAAKLAAALWEWIKDVTPPALRALGDFLLDVGEWIVTEGIPKLAKWAADLGGKLLDWISDIVPKIPGELGKFIGAIAAWVVTDGIPKLADMAFRLADSLLRGIGNWLIHDGPRFIGQAAEKLVAALLAPFKFAFNSIAGFWNDTIGAIHFKLPFGGPEVDFPNIPTLHRGGIVPGRRGQEVLTILEAGEQVISTAEVAEGGGRTISAPIQIDARGQHDPAALADELSARIAWRIAHVGAR